MSKSELYAQNLNGVTWYKSSYSEVDMSECVTVADLPGGAKAVKDSKNPDLAPLRFTASEWEAFIAGVWDGEF